MTKTKSLYLLALACVFSLQLCTIAHAQDEVDWSEIMIPNYEEWNEEWNECEMEMGNEECSWEEEEEEYLEFGQAAACGTQYTVVEGDTCDAIAQANGISVDDFLALNPGVACEALQIGAVVCAKGGEGGDTPAPEEGGDTPAPEEGGDTPAPSGDIAVTFDQFSAAITATNGYPAPTEDQYNNFINNYPKAEISTLRELAMFLAEVIWETGGLQFRAEIRCVDTGCPGEYNVEGDDPSKSYYGRGYLQLTWSENYIGASQDLFGDDRLVTDPDQVATNEEIAWQSAFWYWKAKVHSAAGVQDGQFGSATNAINGKLECNPCQGNCPKRNEIYAAVLPALGIDEEANTAGC